MQIVTQPQNLLKYAKTCRKQGQTIALVPTMGNLHKGHQTLLQNAKDTHDQLFCSLFINPMQFDQQKDLDDYPRTLQQDHEMLENVGCDILFQPAQKIMYPQKTYTQFQFQSLAQDMEGAGRPGHFHGVALILCKLFHLSVPHTAFFGQKDWQQCRIAQQLVADLDFDLNIRVIPTIRTSQGLAYSSRHHRLSQQGKKQALILYQTLQYAQKQLHKGQNPQQVKTEVTEQLLAQDSLNMEYFEIVDSLSLQPIQYVKQHKYVSLCIAGYVEGIRLIDNIFLNDSPITAIKQQTACK